MKRAPEPLEPTLRRVMREELRRVVREADPASTRGGPPAKRAEYGGQIVSALLRQLSWSHFVSLIYLDGADAAEGGKGLSRRARPAHPGGVEARWLG